MNFFKSVFSDETPPPSPPSSNPQSPSPSETPKSPSSPATETAFGGGGEGGWSFNGLLQTITTKSESVLETYRRDLQEFSSGLKSETQVLKHVAATSLDVGAAKAQVSLESVGLAIDSLGSAVSEMIFNSSDDPDHSPDLQQQQQQSSSISRDVGVKYSRFESQLRAIQTDESTYVDDVIDEGERIEFEKWKLGFDLGEYEVEVDDLLGRIDEIYNRIVPSKIDRETFLLRYFYRVERLKKAEFVRAKLVNRAIKGGVDDDEDLSWDVDEEDEAVVETEVAEDNVVVEEKEEGKVEVSEGSKDSDISVVSSFREEEGEEEEEMGWDEIEDVGSEDDEKKGELNTTKTRLESEDKEELRKRLSVAEDDEDLTWDIEDDDDDDDKPIKT